MIASLPMYARPSNRAAHDTFWALIRDGLRDRDVAAPDALDHDIGHADSWAHPDLVLGQICNLPLRAQFMSQVTLIGASDYGLQSCPAGHYNSVFVVHKTNPADDPLSLTEGSFVCNETGSQSGYGAAQLWALARGKQFSRVATTGSHRDSIAAVATGQGDIAAIDAQTWRIETAKNPHTESLKVIDTTDATPGMTFITRKGQNPAPYFAAIDAAIRAIPQDAASVLGLRAIVALPPSAYDLPFPPQPTAIHT